jgi:iron complex outermembrane receptor protein
VPLAESQVQIGSYNRYQGNLDLGGPIDPAGSQAFRLTGLFRNSDTWLPGVKDDRAYIAPAFTWRPDEQTSFTFLSEYLNSVTTGNPGFYQTPEGVLTQIFQGDPAFTDFNQEQFRLGTQFEHKFDENVAIRQNLRYSYVFADAKYTQIDFVDPDSKIATRSTGRVINYLDTFGVDNQLVAKFPTGPIDHAVLAGLEYNYAHFNNRIGFGVAPDLDLSVPNPNYGGQVIPAPSTYDFRNDETQAQIGIYIQDQAKWGPWVLTLGGRNDWVRTNSRDDVAAIESAQQDKAATGRVGLTYLAPFGFAPYASYATAFTPTIGFSANSRPFTPVTGNQKEVGIKYQPPGVNALVAAAFFEINQSGTLVTDPDDFAFQIQTGRTRSRGFELDGVASLGPGFNVTAAYTLLDLRFLNGELDTIGKFPSGIPSQTFSIWGDYEFQPGTPLAGFGVGLGMRYIGPNFANDFNTLETEQATLFDAMVRYDLAALDPRLAGVRLQVNAQNVSDTEYVTCQAGFCYFGPRRTISGSLRYRF